MYVIIFIIYKYYTNNGLIGENNYNHLILFSILSIAFGIHGIGHAFSEKFFHYNPLDNKWSYTLNNNDDNNNRIF